MSIINKKNANIHWGTLKQETPLIFADGTHFYNKLATKHKTHKKGFFIFAPSGVGKTYFIENQKEQHWMDGDDLWEGANAHPYGPWWLSSVDILIEIEDKSDVITVQAKKLGFWILGSMNDWLRPDALVIPDWNVHKKYIIKREQESYDGGASSDRFDQVLHQRKMTRRWIKKGVPLFKSVSEATDYLAKKYYNN